ncbi:MAG: SAM-dependent chlorinase/fluorinase [Cytophagales bacterium]|nr:SAM-dependent chlorinase/fluorinase [Cytophagales bacterium]
MYKVKNIFYYCMAAVTFMSDFGEEDHYVAAVKAAILSQNSDQLIIDISHNIRRHDIAHAAYVIKQSYPSFPSETVHLIAVDPVQKGFDSLVAVRLNDHYFVSHDSGIFSLIDVYPPTQSVELEGSTSTFPARDFLSKAVSRLANGESLNALGNPIAQLQTRVNRQLKATKREIVGQVIHVDHYGNLVTNINKSDFDTIAKLLGGNPNYRIQFAREQFQQFHNNFNDVESGDCFVLFNAYGFLEIGINKGRASDLLGLRMETPVLIEFNPS